MLAIDHICLQEIRSSITIKRNLLALFNCIQCQISTLFKDSKIKKGDPK